MGEATLYRIRVRGHVGPALAAAFEGAAIQANPDGASELLVCLPDQAALHGLLGRVRDLGLPLLSVEGLEAPSGEGAET